MRKQDSAPSKDGAEAFAGIGTAKNVCRSQESSPLLNRRVAQAPPLARSAKRADGLSPMACREADWLALGNVAYLTAHAGARLCKLTLPHDRDKKPGGGRRGTVRGYSAASRLRLMARINTVLRSSPLPCFVTLTFPDLFPDFKDAKKKLDTLGKRWKRRYPNTAVLWRMEAIDRKSGSSVGQVAPHFHCMVWGEFDFEQAKLDWFEVCGNSEYAHYRHGTDCQELRTWQEAMGYLAKYLSKESDAACEGRCWGVINRQALPVDRRPVRVRLSWREAWSLRRLIRRAIAAKVGRPVKHAQSLYTADPECLLRFLLIMRKKPRFGVGPQQETRSDQWRSILRT